MVEVTELRSRPRSDLLFVDNQLTRTVHIAASPYKTGTTSLGAALIDLGIGTRDMQYKPRVAKDHKHIWKELNKTARRTRRAKRYIDTHTDEVRRALSEFTRQLAPYDVFSDAPFGHTHIHPFIRKILAPKAKFIWVNREFDSWIESVRNWEITHPQTYPKHTMWYENPETRIEKLQRIWNSKYKEFSRLAEDFPEDCLELDLDRLADNEALCAFYRIENPGRAFPKKNVSRHS